MKILGKKVAVKYLSESSYLDGYKGRCDSDRNEIVIRKDMPVETQEETLLHEVIHNVSDNIGIGLNEEQIKQIGVCLYSVFKDNNINWRLLK